MKTNTILKENKTEYQTEERFLNAIHIHTPQDLCADFNIKGHNSWEGTLELLSKFKQHLIETGEVIDENHFKSDMVNTILSICLRHLSNDQIIELTRCLVKRSDTNAPIYDVVNFAKSQGKMDAETIK